MRMGRWDMWYPSIVAGTERWQPQTNTIRNTARIACVAVAKCGQMHTRRGVRHIGEIGGKYEKEPTNIQLALFVYPKHCRDC